MKTIIVFLLIVSAALVGCVAPPAPAPSQTVALTPPAPASDAAELPTPVPPIDDPTPPAASAEGDKLGAVSPARPTPEYFGDVPVPLPAGIVSETLQVPLAAAEGLRVLYLNETLHVWNVDQASDLDLGWPQHAVVCPWLASNGQFYLTDARGISSLDLSAPVSPTLLLEHFTDESNPGRDRQFCITGGSADGSQLLMQAHARRGYQIGVLSPESGVVRVVESPIGPPGEPWNCPGEAAWGSDGTLLVTGQSNVPGGCSQLPGLFTTQWGGALIPTEVLTGTLPALGDRLPQRAGAYHLTPNADGSRIAFWFDQGYARVDGMFRQQVLTVTDGDGMNALQLLGPVPGRNGPPAWSADGQALYVATTEEFDNLDPHAWQIRRIGLDGSDQVLAELNARTVELAAPEKDGKLLLRILNDRLVFGLHVLDLATGEMQNGPTDVTVLGWLP